MKISNKKHITKTGVVKRNPPKKNIPERVKVGKEIRRILKENFPETKFSVVTEVFSGGDSAMVEWVNGPTTSQVDALISQFKDGNFNGMIDMYEYDYDRTGIGVKYVQTQREISDKFYLQTAQLMQEKYQDLQNIKKPTKVEDLGNNFSAFGRYYNWYQLAGQVLRDIDLTGATGIKEDPNFEGGSVFSGFVVKRN